MPYSSPRTLRSPPKTALISRSSSSALPRLVLLGAYHAGITADYMLTLAYSEMKMTAADREAHARRVQTAKEAEEKMLDKVLKTDKDKAAYKLQVEAKQTEYKRYEQNTMLGRLLYGK